MSTVFLVNIAGSNEVPSRPSTASGVGLAVFDSEDVALNYSFVIQGVDFGPATGGPPQTPATDDDVTRIHFHNNAPGVNGPIVFGQIDPAQDSDDLAIVRHPHDTWSVSGRWETTDPANVSINNFAGVLGSATVGTAVPLYFNVHTNEFTGGEIRGQLVAIADDIDNIVTGTAGNEVLVGTSGNDAILGLAGNDALNGDNGNDVLDAGAGNDILNGGNGDDILYGSFGNDALTGGDDNDSMDGGAGNDSLDGGNGNDTINGGTGNDTMAGQSESDLFVFDAGFGKDIITDFEDNDRIQFADGLFQDAQAVLLASQQVGSDTVITLDQNNKITLQGVQLSSLQESDFLVL